MSHASRIAAALDRSEHLAEVEAARAATERAESERGRCRRRWRGAPFGTKDERLKAYQVATTAALDAEKKLAALLKEMRR